MEFPDARSTAIVSPIALPKPAEIEEKMPGYAYGREIPKIVSRCDAPNAYDANSVSFGVIDKTSSESVVIVGIVIIARVMLALRPVSPIGRLKIFEVVVQETSVQKCHI